MPSVSITWHAVGDDRTCPICLAINNYKWTFTDMVPDSLIHPQYGEVWNVVTGSLAHEQKQFGKKHGLLSNCRCHITPEFDLKDVLESVRKLLEVLKAEVTPEATGSDYIKGGSRKTTFEDIGIDPAKYGFE